MKSSKTGLWLIGAYGDIATTLIVGSLALKRGLTPTTGLITETSPFKQLPLLPLQDIVIGGHDIINSSTSQAANKVLETSRSFSHHLLPAIEEELHRIDADIVVDPELAWDTGCASSNLPSLGELGLRLRNRLKEFKSRHSLGHIVVVNLASAEAYIPIGTEHESLVAFRNLIATDDKAKVSPSMLCAYTAFQENCSYINFGPNPGSSIEALRQMASEKGLPHCGNDGKTGETLVKTALAPMFMVRNLRVMSWEGTNLLGNNDGKTLHDPEHRKNKVKNKESVLANILGYPVHSGVDINYVPSLGDWKTAWNLIHFKGFLDVPMTMQFTWQGCDSILAAPLVLDLARFAEFAARNGEGGLMKHLACFFKNPQGVGEQALSRQFDLLLEYTERHLSKDNNIAALA